MYLLALKYNISISSLNHKQMNFRIKKEKTQEFLWDINYLFVCQCQKFPPPCSKKLHFKKCQEGIN